MAGTSYSERLMALDKPEVSTEVLDICRVHFPKIFSNKSHPLYVKLSFNKYRMTRVLTPQNASIHFNTILQRFFNFIVIYNLNDT